MSTDTDQTDRSESIAKDWEKAVSYEITDNDIERARLMVGVDVPATSREYIQTEGLKVTAEDMGETFPRMVVYFPATGVVRVRRLRSLHNNTIAAEEIRYISTVESKPVDGDIELF